MNAFAVGDLVEARKGETVVQGRVGDNGVGQFIETGDPWIESYELAGFEVKLVEKAEPQLPELPTKRGSVVLVETEEGWRHFLGWRSTDDWDVITPRGMASITDDLYEFARDWSGSKISAVTILKDGVS